MIWLPAPKKKEQLNFSLKFIQNKNKLKFNMCINIHSLFRYIENWAEVHLVSTNHLSDVLTTWPITQSTCAKLKPSYEVQETVYRPLR